ncbi:hypothetical protein CLU79DRAFT_892297 [Phycomyces nitens]|nr:hypothetical protein CLU79DRAFT_892297 [Phycomyces nitens]
MGTTNDNDFFYGSAFGDDHPESSFDNTYLRISPLFLLLESLLFLMMMKGKNIFSLVSDSDDEVSFYEEMTDMFDAFGETSGNADTATSNVDPLDFADPMDEIISGLNDSTDVNGLIDSLEDLIQDYPFEHSSFDPFKSPLELLLIGFFHASATNFSEQKIKSIMLLMKIAFELKERYPDLKMPAADFVLNYDTRKKSRIPSMTPIVHVGRNKKNEVHPFFMNKPSVYLKYLMADPSKNPMLSSLPDESSGEMNCLQQGAKWRTHEMFQTPMVTLDNGADIWTGDLVELHDPVFDSNCLLISRFFKQKENTTTGTAKVYVPYAQGYLVKKDLSTPSLGCVSIQKQDVPLHRVLRVKEKSLRIDHGLRFKTDNNGQSYTFTQEYQQGDLVTLLWNGKGFSKRWKLKKADGELMKVVLAPLVLFTDDTSGNLSKQYNLFDSYLMTPAAMSYDARSSKNNSYFICTLNNKLSALDMIPLLVDDLKELEKAIKM